MKESSRNGLATGIAFFLTVILAGLLIPENTQVVMRIILGGVIWFILFTLTDKLIKTFSKKS